MSELTRTTPDGTAMFTPPASYSADIYGLANQGPISASRRTVEPFSSRDFSMWPIKEDPGKYAWSWTIRDIAGLNLVRGEIGSTYNRAASSDADTSYFQQGTLPLKVTEQTTAFGTPLAFNIQGVNAFGRQFIAVVSASTPVLLAETSSTDPTLVQIVVAGADAIYGAYNVQANNVGVKNYLALCRSIAPITLLSDLAGTLLGNMNADTAAAAGIVTTPFGNVIKAAKQYQFLPNGSAYNAASTPYNVDAVPSGGWAMGMKGIGNRPIRVYFNVPDGSGYTLPGTSASLAAITGVPYNGHVESTNIYGYDRQQFDMPGLRDVAQSCFFRDGIIGTDLDNVVHMGHGKRTLQPFSDRAADSDRLRKLVGFRPQGDELFWDVEEVAAPGATINSRLWVEHCDWDTGMITQVTPAISRNNITGLQAYRALGALPVSAQTGYFHGRLGPNTTAATPESWRYWRPEAGHSVYGGRTTGGAVAAGYPFHDTGQYPTGTPITITMPETLFPAPITFARKTVTGYYYGGELQYGQVCQVSCSNAPSTKWATPALGLIKNESRWHPVNDSNAGFLLPQPVIEFWAGGSAYSTPQVFPLTIQGYAYTDEHAKGWRGGA